MQVALLRLQDLWLPKILMCGVIMPAGRIAKGAHYKDSTGVVSALAVHISYAILTAGHLLAAGHASIVVEYAEHNLACGSVLA